MNQQMVHNSWPSLLQLCEKLIGKSLNGTQKDVLALWAKAHLDQTDSAPWSPPSQTVAMSRTMPTPNGNLSLSESQQSSVAAQVEASLHAVAQAMDDIHSARQTEEKAMQQIVGNARQIAEHAARLLQALAGHGGNGASAGGGVAQASQTSAAANTQNGPVSKNDLVTLQSLLTPHINAEIKAENERLAGLIQGMDHKIDAIRQVINNSLQKSPTASAPVNQAQATQATAPPVVTTAAVTNDNKDKTPHDK